jgi:hypothetical protein
MRILGRKINPYWYPLPVLLLAPFSHLALWGWKSKHPTEKFKQKPKEIKAEQVSYAFILPML